MAGRNTYKKRGPRSGDWAAGNKPPRPYRSQYARVDYTAAVMKLALIDDAAFEEAEAMVTKATQIGEENMKRLIQQRGTRFSQMAQSEGINKGPGRIRTGNMYDSVSSRVEVGPKKIFASFGWVKNFEPYFSYQETGFRNLWYSLKTKSGNLWYKNGKLGVGRRRTPVWTQGMFALWDSRIKVKSDSPRLVDEATAKIYRRVNGA